MKTVNANQSSAQMPMSDASQEILLTRERAYAAMFLYLETLYFDTGSDDLAVLLGGMGPKRD